MVMDYADEFIAGNPRHASIIKVKSGVSKTGRILAHHMDFIFDSGSYGAFKPIGYLLRRPRGCGARMLSADKSELTISNAGVSSKKQRVSYAQIVETKGSPLVVEGRYQNHEIGPQASMCAQMAEVEVDRESGEIKLPDSCRFTIPARSSTLFYMTAKSTGAS